MSCFNTERVCKYTANYGLRRRSNLLEGVVEPAASSVSALAREDGPLDLLGVKEVGRRLNRWPDPLSLGAWVVVADVRLKERRVVGSVGEFDVLEREDGRNPVRDDLVLEGVSSLGASAGVSAAAVCEAPLTLDDGRRERLVLLVLGVRARPLLEAGASSELPVSAGAAAAAAGDDVLLVAPILGVLRRLTSFLLCFGVSAGAGFSVGASVTGSSSGRGSSPPTSAGAPSAAAAVSSRGASS